MRPKRIERPEPEETTPRFSEQQSLLSRRLSSARATPPATAATPVEVANPAAPAESRLSAQASDLQRPDPPRPVERRLRIDEPSTERSATAAELARRQAEQSPRTLDPATPTFRRRIQQPTEVPRTEVDLAETPAVSEQTRPQELRPHTTLADKRETASPQRPRSVAEPTPQTTADARTPKSTPRTSVGTQADLGGNAGHGSEPQCPGHGSARRCHRGSTSDHHRIPAVRLGSIRVGGIRIGGSAGDGCAACRYHRPGESRGSDSGRNGPSDAVSGCSAGHGQAAGAGGPGICRQHSSATADPGGDSPESASRQRQAPQAATTPEAAARESIASRPTTAAPPSAIPRPPLR